MKAVWGFFFFLVKVFSEGNHEFSGASQRRFVAWSYLRGFIKLRGLLKIGRTTSIIFHSNWRPYLMSSVPALRFKVLHGRVSLVGCKDGNLLAVRSFSGWNDFILWKKQQQYIQVCLEKLIFPNFKIRVPTKEDPLAKLRLSVGTICSFLFVPVVSLSVFSQSRMTKEGQPSTVTTVRLEGGDLGGAFTLDSPGSSSGK